MGIHNFLQTCLSECIVEQVIEEGGAAISEEMIGVMRRSVGGRSDIAELRNTVRSIKNCVSADCLNELKMELAEIADDFTWKKSARGRYVIEINDWVDGFRPEIDADQRFDRLLVGGHAELEVVYIAGKARTQNDLDALVQLVERNSPPRKILINVQVDG